MDTCHLAAYSSRSNSESLHRAHNPVAQARSPAQAFAALWPSHSVGIGRDRGSRWARPDLQVCSSASSWLASLDARVCPMVAGAYWVLVSRLPTG